MLSPQQLDILRVVLLRESINSQSGAWHIDTIISMCEPYDNEQRAYGRDAFRRLLIEPKLMSISPDGQWCKLTDYGLALYQETEALQRDWEEAPVIPLDDAEKDQVVIKAGETFRGKFFVLQRFKRAKSMVRLHDNFCAHELLAWLYDVQRSVTIHILTSTRGVKQDQAFESLYRAFKNERPSAEVRLTDDVHDRKIIVDDSEAFQVGESIKDIGRKGTTIIRLKSVSEHIAQFDAIWSEAKPL